MADMPHQELISERVHAGSRTYFFDIKATSDGTKYLVISESRQVDGIWKHQRVMVFMEHLEAFRAAFVSAAAALGGSEKAYSVEEVRRQHARAYEPWEPDEDQRLRDRYEQGATIAELAIEFKRRESAIRSRLAKLGFSKTDLRMVAVPDLPLPTGNDLAKVLALKAYLLVQQATPQEYDALRAKAESAICSLASSESIEDVRRRIFYRLVLAELTRDSDPIPARAAALDDGVHLEELGYGDPVIYYMRIVEATTESYQVSPTGVLVQPQRSNRNLAKVLAALHLEESTFARYEKFLQLTTLDEIRTKHGIM